MTPSELAAYRAGLKHAAEMALISTLTIELRDDAGEVRQRAAIEALRGLAEGLKAEAWTETSADASLPAQHCAGDMPPETRSDYRTLSSRLPEVAIPNERKTCVRNCALLILEQFGGERAAEVPGSSLHPR